MTMRDDSELRVLERDLRMLAEPREGDESLRVAIRAQLTATPHPRRLRRPLGIRLTVGLTAVTAAAAVGVFAFVGTSGSGGPAIADAAIVHHALRAVTPPAHKILHVEVMGVQDGVRVMAESWQETSPPYAGRGIKGEVGHQGESADNGRTTFVYDPSTNTIYERPDAVPPTFTDPAALVRRELSNGRAQVAGPVVIAGARLYKLDLPHGLVAYVNVSNYRLRYLDDPQRGGGIVRLRVAAYQYLPMTAANRALLSVTAQHPSARIVQGSGGGLGK
jgi:hypothetical protein